LGTKASCRSSSAIRVTRARLLAPARPPTLAPAPRTSAQPLRVVRVDNALRDLVLDDIGVPRDPSRFPRGPRRDRTLASRFTALVRAITAGDRLCIDERLAAFLALVGRRALATPPPASPRRRRAVRRARDLLHARFDETITLDDLAASAETDRFGLLRAFTSELGITPHAYQMQLRMARACRLIANGVLLTEVAHAVGYSEQSALCRPFKQLIGVTPSAYARAVR
jgi:AraC-like DNA-binding protein